jgi:hypothetical protein
MSVRMLVNSKASKLKPHEDEQNVCVPIFREDQFLIENT